MGDVRKHWRKCVVGAWYGLVKFNASMCSVRQGLSSAMPVRRTVSQGRGELCCGITGGAGGAMVAAFSVLVLGEHAQSVRASFVVRLTDV